MALFNHTASNTSLIKEIDIEIPFSTSEIEIVFFDLETGGFDPHRYDILQICMISEKFEFNVYITPTKAIHPEVSNIHGLTKSHTKLFKNGIEIPTFSLPIAMQQLLQFLQKLNKKILLVAVRKQFRHIFFGPYPLHYTNAPTGREHRGFFSAIRYTDTDFFRTVPVTLH